jgi:hypothetical protein
LATQYETAKAETVVTVTFDFHPRSHGKAICFCLIHNRQNARLYGSIPSTDMPSQRPRATRRAFTAHIEVVNMEYEFMLQTRTCDLSLFGCYVKTPQPWAVGTKVRVRISHKGAMFTAYGHVAHTRQDGMGIQFVQLTEKDELILEIWMAELRGEMTKHQS